MHALNKSDAHLSILAQMLDTSPPMLCTHRFMHAHAATNILNTGPPNGLDSSCQMTHSHQKGLNTTTKWAGHIATKWARHRATKQAGHVYSHQMA